MQYLLGIFTFLLAALGVSCLPNTDHAENLNSPSFPLIPSSDLTALHSKAVAWDGGPPPPIPPPPGPNTYVYTPGSPGSPGPLGGPLGGAYACTGVNWSGQCYYNLYPQNLCIVMPYWLNKTINSFGPDKNVALLAFDTPNCVGTYLTLTFPGSGNLGFQGWGSRVESFGVMVLPPAK
ncbi:hypothetical protein M422DRAFT_43108 [Sphaerobolus stellatus SS14]|nr:hypothetical protein M422DRAFT_43108 [Sphaerobolus stellatus SS14]